MIVKQTASYFKKHSSIYSLLYARPLPPQHRFFSSNSSSSLFTKRLKELRQSIKDTESNPASTQQQPSQDQEQFQQNTAGIKHGVPDLVRAELVYSMDLDDVLSAMKRARSEGVNRQSNDFYNACLERINSLTTERGSRVGKSELIKVLREVSYYRPKEQAEKERMRKTQGIYTRQEAQDDLLSVRHKKLIEEKSDKFRTVPGDMANFLFQNLTKGFFKEMFTQFDDEQQSKTKTSLYDVLSNYIQLYQNVEVRINDMLSQQGLIDPKDSLDVLVSYAIAEEGTNTLYIRLVESMLQRTEEYNLVEIEMVMNYFPHNIWKSDPQLTRLRDIFYQPMIGKIGENIGKVDKRQFLSIFQGLSLTGEGVFRIELLNNILNSYVQRLKADEGDKSFTLKEVMMFLELFVQYLRSNQQVTDQIDTRILIKFTNEIAIDKSIPQLSILQISGLYWIYHNLGGLYDSSVIEKFEERISRLLRSEIQMQKSLDAQVESEASEGLQTMNVNDLEVIEHYYNTDTQLIEVSKRHKELLKLIKQAKHLDKPETERKWFHI
ncbi:hypothetical protein FGO68_gene16543 [Halteria grandinella]|uniref:Uncharacterized protein n=1 Tax=Halteria grandinella TaxID=5974 RepID=A0A8J8T817_HALGN|nr:hypothetical protein FGO68_gene16543 [Halteria grandinella]